MKKKGNVLTVTYSQDKADSIRQYYSHKGFKTDASFLRKVICQYMAMYPVRSQECEHNLNIKTISDVKEVVRGIIREELKNL